MKLRWGSLTDTGRVRDANEDNILARRPVFAVADGMGGHAAGEVASRIAVDTLARAFGDEHPPTREALITAVQEANRTMVRQSLDDLELRGMGTTLCGIAILGSDDDERILVFNVGDSRVYRLRDGQLERLTTDHSYVQELVEAGEITSAEARLHPQRNIVTRALGIDEEIEVDTVEEAGRAADRYLLCSDGLVDELDDPEIEQVLTVAADPQDAAEELTRVANDAGGHDNVSVVVIDVLDPAAPEDAALAGQPPPTGEQQDVGGWLDEDAASLDPSPVPPPTSPQASDTVTGTPTVAPRRTRRRSKLTGALIIGAAVLVVGAAFAAIQYYGKASYYVGFAGEQVAVYHGRPGGVLWVDPTVASTYPLTRADLTELGLQRVDQNATFGSRAAADRYVSNLASDRTAIVPPPTTTTTTTTTTTVAPTTVARTLPPTTRPPAPPARPAPPTT